jgi:hypothetical protein
MATDKTNMLTDQTKNGIVKHSDIPYECLYFVIL